MAVMRPRPVGRCYQVMECEDPRLLEQWIDRWKDLVKFEVVLVMTSPQAAELMSPRL